MDANTAEGLADNARFDYLVSVSVFDNDGNSYFEDIDDYKRKSSDTVAIKAAGEMANILYDLDPQFENNLPENKFLKQYKFVDEELRLVNQSKLGIFLGMLESVHLGCYQYTLFL